MLSEKAKGKQRAIDPEIQPGPSTPLPLPKSLVIRFTEGIEDLAVDVHEQDTIKDVKKFIRECRPQLKDRRLRLIHSGRLFADNTSLYPWISSLEEKQREQGEHVGPTTPGNPTIWLHCSIGPQLTGDEEDDSKVQTAQLKPLRGFDRLAAAGFTEQDIANIRMQFHAHSAGDYLDQEYASDEDVDEHARALEEQWIDSIGDNAGGASLTQNSSSTATILRGICMGFFFPIIPLFFLHNRKPAVFWEDGSEHNASQGMVFSRRTQMGIVVGFIMNLVFGAWTYLLAAP